jgi:2-methylcitrate dehydratase PrpD
MTTVTHSQETDRDAAYLAAFADWLACASAGAGERAARAMRALGDDLVSEVAFAGTAGHVLDFDDTLAAGVAHVSAPTAPAALVMAAHLGLPLRAALDAYAEGFEAMASVAEASHPALYEAGWHPTAVCGPIGAVVAASRLLELSASQRDNAVAVALLRAGSGRGSFGSDGKAIQVGLAAAAGVQAALLARAGAVVDQRAIHGRVGFVGLFGATWPRDGIAAATLGSARRAIDDNWIKLYPSCLGTHAPIDAADDARAGGYRISDDQLVVAVHPVARKAANADVVRDGLSAKFSIPYCVAYTLIHGAPGVAGLAGVDDASVAAARSVRVSEDSALPEFGAVLTAGGRELARVPCPRGAPERPATAAHLATKIADLAGDRLAGVLDDLGTPAAGALRAAGLDRAGAADAAAQRAAGLDRAGPADAG